MSYHSLLEWRRNTSQMKLRLRDEILTGTSENLQENVWHDIFQLYLLCSFSGLQDHAKALLEAYFDAQPGFEPPRGSQAKRILGLVWNHCSSAKSGNIPWDIAASDDQKDDPSEQRMNGQEINDGYDPHQWKTSQDPWTHAICARLLCRVPEGRVPDRAAVRESFDAVDRLFTQLPQRSNGMPHCHIFPMKVYFSLAAGLGKRQKARDIFKLACTVAEWCPGDLLPIPALYEVYFGDDDDDGASTDLASTPSSSEQLIAASAASAAVSVLTSALAQRKHHGRQEPLHGVAWPELLQRFSDAAFQVHRDDYAETDDDPPQEPLDILLPPIAPEALAEVEQALGGPLPADLREMALIANGFRGAWHFAGGGFPGVDKLCAVPSADYEIYFGVWPEPTTVLTRTEARPDGTTAEVATRVYEIGIGSRAKGGVDDAGPVWAGQGAAENDCFEHVVCPPETWRRLVARGRSRRSSRGGAEVEEEVVVDGEYRVIHFAYWEGGGHVQYKSMRHWIASETAEMERQLELEAEEGEANEDDGGEASGEE
ncbi:hypothetical protein C8A03DRAFT_19146 [Achaetomium macrosporum]|uniref:Knr4/Smi1-like domain-containing protein n=1 Tax=Achaetomium macrosporum TaxID=79813 RepID=A0AAN7C219_9PEZI|nr:hypothetical protein C8A03DRAFT_19146 [Achaetomium macrosporum]